MTSRQEQRDANAQSQAEQVRIYSVNKLVDKLKQSFPGMTSLKVFFYFYHIKVSKIGLHYVMPLGVMVNKKLIDNEDIINFLDETGFLFNIKESQFNYMSMRKNLISYWCLDIDCSKQIEFKSFKYYNSKLLSITDEKIIKRLVPPTEEFDFNDFEPTEAEIEADLMAENETD